MQPHRRFECVCFDLDGTLANTLPVLYAAYEAFVRSFNAEPSQAEFELLNGPPLKTVVRLLKEKHGLPGPLEDLYATYCAAVDEHLRAGAPASTGAQQLIPELRNAGYRLGLVTASSRAWTTRFLEQHGWTSAFDALVTGDDAVHGKPDPTCYVLALERLGIKSVRAAAVEDSPNGVASAKCAGLYVFGYAVEGRAHELKAAGADQTVANLRDIPKLLAETQ